ncbi:hypothetical protein OESDEN_18229, partial [Oesophagostomum dentatum]
HPHGSQNPDSSTHDSAGGSGTNDDVDIKPHSSHADPDSDAANLLSTELEVDPSRDEANARMRLVRGDITPPPILGVETRREPDSVPTEEYVPRPQRQRYAVQRVLHGSDAAKDEEEANSAPAPTQEPPQHNPDKFER